MATWLFVIISASTASLAAARGWTATSPSTTTPTSGASAHASAAGVRESGEETPARQRLRRQWLLSFEGVTHAPVDMGLQLGLETPQRLRLFGGYGWVPGAYMNLLTGVAANASRNTYAEALLDQADYAGHTWRVQAGWRPFRALGLYGDVGYARLNARGSLDLASSGVPMLETLGGGYLATTALDMWLVELGYQGQLAERLVLGLALGAMGTFSAHTRIMSVDGAPSSPLLERAAAQADSSLESYGIVPTLTLRLGLDLI
jgi:hypothetical protein